MTTTELIKILQDNEKGGISHKPRNISLNINGRWMVEPQISLSSTGDGICGPEIDLDIEGDWIEREEERMIVDYVSTKVLDGMVWVASESGEGFIFQKDTVEIIEVGRSLL